jgi:hypothetical protein
LAEITISIFNKAFKSLLINKCVIRIIMSIWYKLIGLLSMIVLFNSISAMHKLSIVKIRDTMRSSDVDTLQSKEYSATIDPQRIANAKKILSKVREKPLRLIDTSNIILDEKLPVLICSKVPDEHRSSKKLQKNHIEQLCEIAEYSCLNKDNIVLNNEGNVVIEDIVLPNPYPYDYTVHTTRYGSIKNTITEAKQINLESADMLKALAGISALLDNNIEDKEVRDRLKNILWKARNFPSLQIDLTNAAIKSCITDKS